MKSNTRKAALKKAVKPVKKPGTKHKKLPGSNSPIKHVVIIFKENHGFDNYFGTFPGANGDASLPHLADPPTMDPVHTHEAWLKRATNAVKGQYHLSDIPNYFSLAKQYTLCDNYFTDVAGPSTPNHLMAIAGDSPIIANPHHNDPKKIQPPFNIPSLPENLQKAGLSWKNYGGYAFDYITKLKNSPNSVLAGQFAADAAAGKLPNVSWVYGPKNLSEHPTEVVADGDAWTAAQIKAIVKGGLWSSTAVLITWDDWGGWYDHVTPPMVEKWTDGTQFRYGNRVGCIVVSPFVKPGYISSVLHSHVSMVKFCETIFGLAPVNKRVKAANDLMDCFDFKQKPLPVPTFK
jgi:phospholipase C